MISRVIGLIVFVGLAAVAYHMEPQTAGETTGSWYSVLPPLLAVVLAFVTHNVFLSLVGAILLGAGLIEIPGAASLASVFEAFKKSFMIPIGEVTDIFNIQVLAFVVLVLSLISVVIVSGGLKAAIDWVSRYAKDKKSTKMVTVILGLLIFIDDYANTMLVGSSMRPVSDSHKISREKLAFLVDATAAPIAGLAFISTWVGYEVGLFKSISDELNLGMDGYSMFFDALSFRFYCIFMLIFVFMNVLMRRDFGPMAAAEHRAETKGEVLRSDARVATSKSYAHAEAHPRSKPKIRTAAIPIVFMFVYLFAGLWVDGGGLARLAESPFAFLSPTEWRDVISASENNVTVLYQAAGIGLILAFISSALWSGLKFNVYGKAALNGAKASLLPLTILILAWSIKTVCKELQTGPFLVAILGDVISPIWFPLLLFVIAGITAFTTGTSWGTMAILIPVAIPLAHTLDGSMYGLVTMISLGAILDGAIFGDHCSPISDTTIMSSISTGCDHMDHVKTQIPYSVLVAFVALFSGYLLASNGVGTLVALLIGSIIMAGLYFVGVKAWGGPLKGR